VQYPWTYYAQSSSADADMDSYDEVDLQELEFDEENYLEHWALRTDIGKIISSSDTGTHRKAPSPDVADTDRSVSFTKICFLPNHV